MYHLSLKPVLVGIGIGLLLFAIPFFLLKAALVVLLFGAVFRFVSRRIYGSRRRQLGYAGHRYAPYRFGAEWHPAFADTIRNMSEDEYSTFRQKLAEERPYQEADHKTTIEIQ